MRYWLLFLGIGFLLGFMTSECTHKPITDNTPEPRTEALKDKIATKEAEVLEIKKEVTKKEKTVKGLKDKKDSIHYVKDFDSTATVNDVKKELLTCDSVNTISNEIIVGLDSVTGLQKTVIANQDTIISDQKQVIAIVESQNTTLKRDIKKQKRKLLLTKIGAGVVVVVSILLAK